MRFSRNHLLSGAAALTLLGFSPCGVAQSIQPDQPAVTPYEGTWVAGSGSGPFENWVKSGSGLLIDVQDDTLVAGLFTYDEQTGAPVWYLASGEVENGVFEAPAYRYTGGSCLGCTHVEPVASESVNLRLEFTGKAVGYLSLNGAAPVPIRVLPFDSPRWTQFRGANMTHGWYAMFDLTGRWIAVAADKSRNFSIQLDLKPQLIQFPIPPPGTNGPAYFSSEFGLGCGASLSGEGTATCTVAQNSDTFLQLFIVYWGDLTPLSATGFFGDGAAGSASNVRGDELVHMFRLTAPPEEGEPPLSGRALPIESGVWVIPGKPGSGFFFERQNDTLVFVVFTYDEAGNPIWYQGSGEIIGDTVEASAYQFTASSGIAAEYLGPPISSEPVSFTFTFSSYTTADVDFAGDVSFPIEAFAFDSPGFRQFGEPDPFGQPHLYDLSGEWIFVSRDGMDEFFRRVTFTNAVSHHGGSTLSWKNAANDVSFRCDADERFASPQCRLIILEDGQWQRLFSAHWADVGEDKIIGYLERPLPGDNGVTRGEDLIYGFRLPEPDS